MRAKISVEERFWNSVQKTETCWLWTAGKDSDEYGWLYAGQDPISKKSFSLSAHRYSYELHYGPIPEGMFVCHTCDNPSCVNPAHLFLGTPQDNSLDRNSKGRHEYGVNHWKSKLTEDQVREIRSSNLGLSELGRKYGVSPQAIQKIRKRITWKEVDDQPREK